MATGMHCPACGHPFRKFTSWRYSPIHPFVCSKCGTRAVRGGRLQPLVIAVVGIIVYGFVASFYPLTLTGRLLTLGLVMFAAIAVDERLIDLVALDKPGDADGGSEKASAEAEKGEGEQG